jgi:hypothetical protein
MFNLGELLKQEGDLKGARAKHESALQIRRQLQEAVFVEESELAIAGLDLEEGRPQQAITMARAVLPVFEKKKSVDDEIQAQMLLARASRAAGDLHGAAEAIRATSALRDQTQDRRIRFESRIVIDAVRAAIAPGDKRIAKEIAGDLNEVISETRAQGLIALTLEARLAWAELQPQGSTKIELEPLQRDARSKGFELIARKAQNLEVAH